MTREQQKEVLKILTHTPYSEDVTVDDRGWVSKDADIYTEDIDALRVQGARIYYRIDREQMRISNWQKHLMKEPEKPKESATRMEVRAFYDEDYTIQLVKNDGIKHDHIHIVYEDRDLGYLHIDKERIQWCPFTKVAGDKFIKIGEDC